MRLRTSLAAALGALTLVLTLPTAASASAATGDFTFKYKDVEDVEHSATYTSPEDGDCLALVEVENDEAVGPAYSAVNSTDRLITLYSDLECGGESRDLAAGQSVSNFTFRTITVAPA
ncbi:hypothetical protein [Streptomyces sp. NPDC089919]|uniref:hypothetical protein n=1 Tax=Streptomyces sp. NPDC089919 TaxID=3155188 RepID=UPI003427132E